MINDRERNQSFTQFSEITPKVNGRYEQTDNKYPNDYRLNPVTQDVSTVNLEYAKPERDKSANSQNLHNTGKHTLRIKELYDYVFDNNASSELDKFYKFDEGAYDRNNDRDVEIKCSDNLCDRNQMYCNTAKTTQEELRGHYSGFNKPQCETDIDQNKHHYILKKYKDEKEMNGGLSCNGTSNSIMGFDAADISNFSSLN